MAQKQCELPDERLSLRRPVRSRQTREPVTPDGPFVTTVTCLAEIAPEPVVWLWGDLIARGKVTLLTGASGVGKSFVGLDVAAAVTRGRRDAWQEPRTSPDAPAEVLLISPDHELADVVRPRLEAAGAVMTQVHAVRGVRRQDSESDEAPCWAFHLKEDLRLLEHEIARRIAAGSALRLIVIDPFPADAFEGRPGTKALNQTMKHLAEIAAWSGAAILLVTETPLQPQGSLVKVVRGLETAAPSAWTVGIDPDDPERRLLLPIKSNLKQKVSGRAFTICDGRVQWEAEAVSMTASQFQAESHERSKTQLYTQEWSELARATEWLQRRLKNGPVALGVIKRAADHYDISYSTLRRAFCGLRGISQRTWNTPFFQWSLPNPDIVPPPFPPCVNWEENEEPPVEMEEAEEEETVVPEGNNEEFVSIDDSVTDNEVESDGHNWPENCFVTDEHCSPDEREEQRMSAERFTADDG